MPIALDQPQRANLRRLLLLRVGLLFGAIVTAYDAAYMFQAHLNLAAIVATVGALLVISAASWLRIVRGRGVYNRELHGQIIVDVIGLTTLLYFAGGAGNPFTLLYLIPVSMAAAALASSRATWSIVGLSIACYSLLLLLPVETPPHQHSAQLPSPAQLHHWGMWVGFVASSCLIAYFAVSARRMIRERDQHLAQQRERALRDSQLVQLGTLAAGAAHELGTPLGTLAILTDELKNEYGNDANIQTTTRIMAEQIARCKESLAVLSARSGQQRAESGRMRPANHYLQEIVDNWKASRPEIEPVVRINDRGITAAPLIMADLTLTHALTNILNNAADASPTSVEIDASWDQESLTIDILDRGPGLSSSAAAQVGKVLFTTKGSRGGLGIGAFLAYSTIDRLGGTVQIMGRDGGGTCVRIIFDVSSTHQCNEEDNSHVDHRVTRGDWREAATTSR